MLDPDRPISRDTDDLLGRGALADQLATWVRDAPMQQGFVIGVTGAWGSGKTSVLNLLAARLPDATTVVRFDPWLFSDADQLVTRFFEELAGQLLHARGRRVKRLARRLADYGAAIGPAASVVLGPAGQLLGAPRQVAALNEQTAASRREAVRKALLSDPQRIVVLIDDIDRLDAREIREVMRLVKLVADLPGVVHVLSYDRARVQSALSDHGRQDGRAYLEKIVQATMAVPPVARDRLRKLTFDWVQEAIGERELESWDVDAWSELVIDGIENYIETLRDGRRLANMVPAVLDLTADEVAAMDVIALEAIRIFDPDVHESLASVAGELTGERSPFDFMIRDKQDEEARVRLAAVLKRSGRPEVTRGVLAKLFPPASALLGEDRSSARDSRWLEAKRVASLAVLRRYLHRSLSTGEAPSARVDQVVEALADAEALEQLLTDAPDEELDDLLRRARNRLAEQSTPDVVGCSLVLLRAVPRIASRPGFFEVEAARRIMWFVEDLLATLDDHDERVGSARRIVNEAPTLSLRVQLLYRLRTPPDKPSETPRLDVLGPSDFDDLRSRLAADVRTAGASIIAREDVPFWLVQVVGEADGSDAALDVLRQPEVLQAVLERSGTSLRPLSGDGISLHLKPLVDAAGLPVLNLLHELAASGTIDNDLADELRDALGHPPTDP
jgi:KAP family P-loop domain